MCLIYNEKQTNEFYGSLLGETVVRWKVMRVVGSELYSLHYAHHWQVGLNKIKGNYNKDPLNGDLIRRGFHVFVNKADAIWDYEVRRGGGNIVVLVEVHCPVHKLIGKGIYDGPRSIQQEVYSEVILPNQSIETNIIVDTIV